MAVGYLSEPWLVKPPVGTLLQAGSYLSKREAFVLLNEGSGKKVLPYGSAPGIQQFLTMGSGCTWKYGGPDNLKGPYLDFDGTSGANAIGPAIELIASDAVSFSIWIKILSADLGSAGTGIVGNWNSGSGVQLYLQSGKIRLYSNFSNADLIPTYPTDNQWHHLVLTRASAAAGQAGRGYLDGVLNTTSPAISGSTTSPGVGFRLGEIVAGNPAWFKGSIAEASTFSRELNASEVLQLYRYPLGVMAPKKQLFNIAAAATTISRRTFSFPGTRTGARTGR